MAVEPRENQYDWSQGNATLKRFHDLGRKRTLPPNGHVHALDLTPAIQAEMIRKIAERYLADFFPYGIPVVHLV